MVIQFDYQIDPRVTLANPCKGTQVATGPTVSGCQEAAGGPCADTPPS
jgi:hypothetical protein